MNRQAIAKIVTLFVAVTAVSARAMCEDDLSGLPKVNRVVQPQYAIEVRGQRGELNPDMSRWRDGHYVYLVTRAGEVIAAKKYEVPTFNRGGRGLVTHKNLLNKLIRLKGSRVQRQILVGGEIWILNGHTRRITNRSGNFPASAEHLKSALPILARHGLKIAKNTEIAPINPSIPEERGHTPDSMRVDEFQLRILADLSATNGARQTNRIWRFIFRAYTQLFPGPYAGDLDVEEFSNAVAEQYKRSGDFLTFEVISVLAYSQSSDGLEYGIWSFLNNPNFQHKTSLKRFLIDLQDIAGQKLNMSDRQRLKSWLISLRS